MPKGRQNLTLINSSKTKEKIMQSFLQNIAEIFSSFFNKNVRGRARRTLELLIFFLSNYIKLI